ncbi:hypothetical protein ANCDUO_16380 [Ancylostoma duodenale]|uniref:Uncharacterized protein n=1 Tax=Ancylostoma duodenale TaxID=51022 RepID=A0A0C2G927_9BILA|nr:hypothetical protein ANCDUO_16380 [Ancylostoma duodenale]
MPPRQFSHLRQRGERAKNRYRSDAIAFVLFIPTLSGKRGLVEFEHQEMLVFELSHPAAHSSRASKSRKEWESPVRLDFP